MSRPTPLALLIAAAIASVAVPGRAEAQRRPDTRVEAAPAAGRVPSGGERRIICRGAPIPAGFILVDDLRDRDSCGGENPAALNAYNVWAIERTEGRLKGTIMEVCAATPTPAGWTLVDVYRARERCGHPETIFTANVKRIRKN